MHRTHGGQTTDSEWLELVGAVLHCCSSPSHACYGGARVDRARCDTRNAAKMKRNANTFPNNSGCNNAWTNG
eukprot:5875791-Lingulodinium_polyedra.AAC.1